MNTQEKKPNKEKEAPKTPLLESSFQTQKVFYLIRALSALPGLNFGTFFAGIVIF